jgi:hypothetical protein
MLVELISGRISTNKNTCKGFKMNSANKLIILNFKKIEKVKKKGLQSVNQNQAKAKTKKEKKAIIST